MKTETEPTYQYECEECRLQFRPNLNGCYTLEQAYQQLLKEYPGWFVYRGGSHVALHRKFGADSPRLLLLVEKQ